MFHILHLCNLQEMVAGLEQRIKDLAGLWAERKAPLVEEVEELTKQIKGSAQVTWIRKPLLKYISSAHKNARILAVLII